MSLARIATPQDYERPDSAPASGLAVLSWSDILAEPPAPPPTIAPGIPKVGLTVLAGPPKIGKTLQASQTALTVGRSLLVVEEGAIAGVSFRLRHQAAALGIDKPDIAVIHRQGIRLDNRATVGRLRAYVTATRPRMVVFDPLNRLHTGDENRPSQMTPVMDAMAGLAYDYECAVVAIHHLAKPSAERRGDIWDRFRGATSIRSGTDANLVMEGSGSMVRMVGEFRDAEPLSMYLELDRESLLFSEVDGPKAQTKIDPDALREYVTDNGPVTARSVMDTFGVKSKVTALSSLEALPGIDSYEGPRGTRYYTFGTVQ